MVVRIEPLTDPDFFPLDARASLEWMKQTCYNISGGQLNDFSEHSPVVAILEAELAGIKDIDVRVQQIPRAMTIAFLQLRGIQRILGSSAIVELTFTIEPQSYNTFRLSKGYRVKSRANQLYATDADLLIPAGQTQGKVAASPVVFQGGRYISLVGLTGNAPPRTIDLLVERRVGLLGVTNEEAAKGGTPAETIEQCLSRGFAAMRRPPGNGGEYVLVSKDDYEQASMDYLGFGSVAIAVPRLSQEKNIVNGAVHLFCLNPDLSRLNTAQIVSLRSDLVRQSQVGLGDLISVSSIELVYLTIRAVVSIVGGSNPDELGDRINAHLTDYLRPGNLPIGETLVINSLEAEIYGVLPNGSSVAGVILITTDKDFENEKTYYSNVSLSHDWQAFSFEGIDLTFVDPTGEYYYLTGRGGDRD